MSALEKFLPGTIVRLARTVSSPVRAAPRTEILRITAASAAKGETSTIVPADVKTPAVIAMADAAFRNLEPIINFTPFSRYPDGTFHAFSGPLRRFNRFSLTSKGVG